MCARQIPVALDQEILPRLLVVLAAAHKNMLGARRELERIAAPNHDIALAARLERADSIRGAEEFRGRQCHCT